jgi:hypothetical protein
MKIAYCFGAHKCKSEIVENFPRGEFRRSSFNFMQFMDNAIYDGKSETILCGKYGIICPFMERTIHRQAGKAPM